jgi:Tol biopolymer transport system component
MRSRANAPSTGSTKGCGSGAPSPRRRTPLAFLAALVLAITVSLGAATAIADSPPVVSIDNSPTADYTTAQVSGTVNPAGGPSTTFWHFEYSTNPSDDSSWAGGPGGELGGPDAEGTSPVPVAGTLESLQPGTEYSVRLVAENQEGANRVLTEAPYPTFTTKAVAKPTVSIDPVTPTATTALFSGHIDTNTPPDKPSAADVLWHFECTPECPGLEGTVTAVAGEGDPEVEAKGLQPNTDYQVTLVAKNAGDPVSAGPVSFKTEELPAPTITIDPVTTFTATTAHFSGLIKPNTPALGDPSASDVLWHFECTPECPGLSDEQTVPGTEAEAAVAANASGLEPNTSYEVTLVGHNVAHQVAAGPVSFKTTAVGPVAETIPAFAFGPGTEALIGGKVNPKNSDTEYWLEYGPGDGGSEPDYPSSTAKAPAGSGGQLVFETQEITGLAPASTYHFRIVAKNDSGTTEGADVDFETLPVPSSPPATCPNDKLRSETSSEALGECRAYEMVTAPAKNGGDTAALTSSPDGNRLAYYSTASFAGLEAASTVNSYVAQRGAGGWATHPMLPKIGAEVANQALVTIYRPADFTEDLSESIALSRGAAAEPSEQNIFTMNLDGSETWLSAPTLTETSTGEELHIAAKSYAGRSADGSHIVFESEQQFDPQRTIVGSQVWEWVNGTIRLVSLLPDGSLFPEGAGVGTGPNGSDGHGTTFLGTVVQADAVSEDGSKIFFGHGGAGTTQGVMVRINGTETRDVTLSQRAGTVGQPASDAQFAGASADGNVAVFTSTQLLTNDATPNGGLYAYDLRTDKLRFLSSGATDPSGAHLESPMTPTVSRDGSRVLFVARSVLVPGKGVASGHNLYVSGPGGVSFIATLGDHDAQNWYGYYGGGARVTTRATADGRYFLFQSWQRITSFDNAGHEEIYRYDADHETLSCISCGTSDHPADGDASIIANPVPYVGSVVPQFGRPRTLTPDGSRIFFQTTDSLLPADVNGLSDVYLYDHGRLSLISAGTSKYDSEVADISPDGRDLFFTTRDSLVGQDIDGGSKDVYDARTDGGFPAPPVANPCEGGAGCQGTPSATPGFASPPTTAPGRGNPKPPKPCSHKAKKKKPKCGSKGKGHHKKHRRDASKTGRAK